MQSCPVEPSSTARFAFKPSQHTRAIHHRCCRHTLASHAFSFTYHCLTQLPAAPHHHGRDSRLQSIGAQLVDLGQRRRPSPYDYVAVSRRERESSHKQATADRIDECSLRAVLALFVMYSGEPFLRSFSIAFSCCVWGTESGVNQKHDIEAESSQSLMPSSIYVSPLRSESWLRACLRCRVG